MIEAIAPRRSPSRSKISSACCSRSCVSYASGAIGSSGRMSSSDSPAATRCTIGRWAPTASCSTNHARIRPSRTTAISRSAEASVASSPAARASSTAARNASSAPSRSTSRAAGVKDSPAVARMQVLAELHARGELRLGVAPLLRERPHLARELGRPLVLLGRAQRRGTAEPDVELEVRVAERLRERAQLGETLEAIGRPAQHVEGAVARLQQVEPLLRRGRGRERDVDDAQDLLRGVGGERVAARLDREPHAHGRVAGGLRMMGQQRQARRRGFARQQQLHDRRVDRAAPAGRQRRGREVADLLVQEAVVGGRGLVVLGQQPGGDGRRERVGERVGVRRRLVVHAGLDLAEILEAEPPAEDGGVGQQRLRLVGQMCGAPRDERAHRRRHEPLGVAREPPHAVDLLHHAAVAVGARHLLDDERDALGLRVHDGRAGLVDRTAEDRRDAARASRAA